MSARATRLVALGLGAATVVLRLPRALGASFWQDEVASARVIQEPTLGSVLHQVARTESTPPLWYALAWLTHLAGVSIHDTRLLSVCFDGLIVAGVVLFAARMLPSAVAVAAGVVAALGAELSAHGRELRAYELFALLAVVFAFVLARAARSPDARALVCLAGVTAAGLLTHYFFVFTVLAGLLWLITERRATPRVVAALGAGVAVCAPWTPFFLRQLHADRYSWIGSFSAAEVLQTPGRLIAVPLGTPITLVWLMLAAVLAWRAGPTARLLVWLALAPVLLAGAVWAGGMRVYAVRNLIAAAPFVSVLAVAPLAALSLRVRVAAAVLLSGALATSYAINQLQPDVPYKRIAQALVDDGWHGADPIAVVGGLHALRSPLEWYLPDTPRFVPSLRRPRRPELVYVVLGEHSDDRSVAHDAIRVGRFLVGLLPAGDVQERGRGRLTLFAPARQREIRVPGTEVPGTRSRPPS